MALNAQQYFSYIVAVSFYWWRKPEYPEKTTDKLYHLMLSITHRHEQGSNSYYNFSGDRH